MRWREGWIAEGGKMRGQLSTLVADIGDRDDLPKGGTSKRAHREQTPRRDAAPVYHGAILCDVDADVQGVRAGQTVF